MFRLHGSLRWLRWAVPLAAMLIVPAIALAQDAAPADATAAPATAPAEAAATPPVTGADAMFTSNNVWMMLCTGLVFLMHLGFATLEAGLCRRKNCVNILTKNTAIPMIGVLTYCLVGFSLMYPGDSWLFGEWLAKPTVGIGTDDAGVTSAYNAGYTYWTDFLFQAMFCATACTIVSGAMAERVKLLPFLVFATLFTAAVYPVVGSWKWGMGWLQDLSTPFYDFAGSTLVHSVGGWAALAGIFLLGPRLGKYDAEGRVHPIPGHSMPMATIGVFLLFLGWFGFNGGSVLSANPAATSLVLVTTTLAGAAGTITALITSNFVGGKPDLSMALNGALAGLVGITAGADQMLPLTSIIIGGIAGVLVVLSVVMFDKLRIDDPVGALSVHLVCGIWGTLAVGIFGKLAGVGQLVSQLIGIAAVGATTLVLSLVIFGVIKSVSGIRVSAAEEIEGLDIGEHGMEAYVGFSGESVGTGESGSPVNVHPATSRAVVAPA
jgi:Amt family ammonium transporter